MRKSSYLLLGMILGAGSEHVLNKIPQYAKWGGIIHDPVTIPFPENEKEALAEMLHAHIMMSDTKSSEKTEQGQRLFKTNARELRANDICMDPIDRHDAATMFVRCSDPSTTFRVRVTFNADATKAFVDYY